VNNTIRPDIKRLLQPFPALSLVIASIIATTFGALTIAIASDIKTISSLHTNIPDKCQSLFTPSFDESIQINKNKQLETRNTTASLIYDIYTDPETLKPHILVSPTHKTLVVPKGFNLSQDLSAQDSAVVRQWLVGSKFHPNLNPGKLQLKRFQKEAIAAFHGLRKRGERKMLLVSPGGTGKSEIAVQIIKSRIDAMTSSIAPTNQSKLIVVLTDQRLLLRQLTKSLNPSDIDSTIWGDNQTKADLEGLLKTVADSSKNGRPHLLFSTSQSFKRQLLTAEIQTREDFAKTTDLVIIDEGHLAGSEQMRDLLPKWLDIANGPFLFGMTATPLHMEANIHELYGFNSYWAYLDTASEFLNRTTDKVRSITEVVTQLERAITAGDITPIDRVHFISSLDFFNNDTNENAPADQLFIKERNDELGRQVLNPQLYNKVFARLSPLIRDSAPGFFATATITEAERVHTFLASSFPDKKFKVLHSKLTNSQINKIEMALRNHEIDFVITVRMLDQGIDLPQLKTYIDLTASISPRQLVQRLARTTRLAIDKHSANVALFLNVNESTVRDSLALVDQILLGRTRGDGQNVSDRQLNDFIQGLPLELTAKDIDAELSKLRSQLYDFWLAHRKSATERSLELNSFVNAHRRLPSTSNSDQTEISLGKWLNYFKFQNPDTWFENLDPQVIEFLKQNKLLQRRRASQSERIKEFEIFLNINSRIPSIRSEVPIEAALASWFYPFKFRNKTTWQDSFSDATKKLLIELKLIDGTNSVLNLTEHLNLLNQFIIRYKTLPSTKSDNKEIISLANWLGRLKAQDPTNWYKSLPKETQDFLIQNKLTGRLIMTRTQRLTELSAFIVGNLRMPSKSSSNKTERSLAEWFAKYRPLHILEWKSEISTAAQNILLSL
jgi:superfamily II DNA or RNA helicase